VIERRVGPRRQPTYTMVKEAGRRRVNFLFGFSASSRRVGERTNIRGRFVVSRRLRRSGKYLGHCFSARRRRRYLRSLRRGYSGRGNFDGTYGRCHDRRGGGCVGCGMWFDETKTEPERVDISALEDCNGQMARFCCNR